MAEDTVAAPLGEVRLASAANGTALTTTAAFIQFPVMRGGLVTLMPRNVVTAVVIRYALNPYLIVFKTSDNLAAVGNITSDILGNSENLQDNDTTTNMSLNSLDTAANNNFLFIGSHIPFRGVRVIIGNTNSNASVLTVKYRKSNDTWADITATDGTTGGGATFNATGNVTWTLPTDWIATSLRKIYSTDAVTIMGPNIGPAILAQDEIYWTRWETSAAFDATVTATGMLAMNRSTTYGEFDVNLGRSFRFAKGMRGLGNIEALTDAGTANLIVEVASLGVGSKLG